MEDLFSFYCFFMSKCLHTSLVYLYKICHTFSFFFSLTKGFYYFGSFKYRYPNMFVARPIRQPRFQQYILYPLTLFFLISNYVLIYSSIYYYYYFIRWEPNNVRKALGLSPKVSGDTYQYSVNRQPKSPRASQYRQA